MLLPTFLTLALPIVQDDSLQEVQETHKHENHSLSAEIRKLKTQLTETEALFEAAQRATSNVEQAAGKQKEDVSRLEKELEQAKNLAKEEEEKRVKAITLLKTVRQKLVKAEKDRDDTLTEMAAIKEREKSDKEKEQVDRLNFLREVDAQRTAHLQEITDLRSQFEKDISALQERHEHEISVLRGQREMDLANAKVGVMGQAVSLVANDFYTLQNAYAKELAVKNSQTLALEKSLNSVTRDKNTFFDQLQLRQVEIESMQAHLNTMQHQNTELEFQLREANDRLGLLKEEYAELQREAESRSREPTTSAEEISQIMSAIEVKYEAKIAEMKRNISVLEKERHESEADWSRKLKDKVRELEDLKSLLGSATRMRESEESMLANLKLELERTQELNEVLKRDVLELPILREQTQEMQVCMFHK